MDDKRIREGDTVDIHWANDESAIDCIVIHTPAGPGDLWQFEIHGEVWALNPYASTFEGIVRR